MNHGPQPQDSPDDLESTAILLKRAREGDAAAVNRLFDRYYPLLKAIAHGRLPHYQRDLKDSDDLVQETLIQAFKRLDAFEYRREGAFLAYLRQILLNEIRQEVRRKKRRPGGEPLHDGHIDGGQTPAEVVSEWETVEQYERALEQLSRDQYEAIVMRLEFGLSYEEIARNMGRPSANAARMVVSRALARVARLMGRPEGDTGNPDG